MIPTGGARMAAVLALLITCSACSGVAGPSPSDTADATNGSPATPSMSPSPSPSPSGSPSPPGETAAHCGASIYLQLAYELPGMDAVEVDCDIAYTQVDGVETTLDLYLPPGADRATGLPVVVFVHGNDDLADPLRPIKEHWKRDGYTNGLVAAASGWAGVTFDYRGYRRTDPDALAAAQQDVLDLLAHLDEHADELGLDPTQVCLWASSGGGLPAAWAAMRGEPRPRCVVTFSARLDGDAAPTRDPVTLINADQPPFFVARGELDPYAYQGSMRFVERATAEGAEIVIEDHPGGHGFEQTAEPASLRIIDAALAFLRAHLTGP